MLTQKTKHHYFIILIASLWAVVAHAQPVPVAFDIVPAESSVRFEVMQGTAKITGQFPAFTAHIMFHPEALISSKVDVTVDMNHITMDNTEAQQMLAQEEWLSPKAFPNAEFTTQSFKSLGDKRYEAQATLTLKGVAIPLVLAFTLDEFSPAAALMQGEVTLHRKDFHIGWDDTKSVADEVKVLVKVKAVAAAKKSE